MSGYVFSQEKSFVARWYWKDRDGAAFNLDPWYWQRICVPSDAGGLPIHENTWLRAGHPLEDADLQNEHGYGVISLMFLFCCYEKEGDYRFEIRADLAEGDPGWWRHYGQRLDISRNGYLGLYSTSAGVGEDLDVTASSTWQLPGFEPDDLTLDQPVGGLELLNAHGKSAKCLVESAYPYLNVNDGKAGVVGLKLIRKGVTPN